ncbi:hypothetical protein F511_47046 [Dorcoceras hygrometricum]|uniref:Uncharacterized protein n=1 Tax=Dorcoceras hygrometricum TaxID=472368 RepID=A0A2Z6ZSK1_9LAMI|nr:hypothetical protein F511_47046 [Dorcoceras hygrometricum]
MKLIDLINSTLNLNLIPCAASLLSTLTPPPPPPPPRCRRKFVSGQLDEENPFVLISSGLLVKPDEGVSDLVVDRIGVSTAIYREAPGS